MRANLMEHSRRGLTTVAVLVCLVIITMISGALLKIGVVHRERVHAQERQIQAEWLAQAGLERALARLAASAGYSGETWTLTPGDLRPDEPGGPSGGRAAVVVIKVAPAEAGGKARIVQVQADYPPEPPRRARHTLHVQVDLDSLKTGASR